MATKPIIVQTKNICFSYGNNIVLKDADMEIFKGDFVGMIGPNGAGKSTLVKIILGLLSPDSGEVYLFGVPQAQFHDWYKIGYVPQKATSFDQNFPATVFEVASMGRFSKLGMMKSMGEDDKKKVKQCLELVGMESHANDRIGDLSGGQQQRVFIARALATEPELLILDEPTVGVDPDAQQKFYSILEKLNKKMGMTLLLISHDVSMVTKNANKLACVNRNVVMHDISKGFKEDDLFCSYMPEMKLAAHSHTHGQGCSCDSKRK